MQDLCEQACLFCPLVTKTKGHFSAPGTVSRCSAAAPRISCEPNVQMHKNGHIFFCFSHFVPKNLTKIIHILKKQSIYILYVFFDVPSDVFICIAMFGWWNYQQAQRRSCRFTPGLTKTENLIKKTRRKTKSWKMFFKKWLLTPLQTKISANFELCHLEVELWLSQAPSMRSGHHVYFLLVAARGAENAQFSIFSMMIRHRRGTFHGCHFLSLRPSQKKIFF